MNSKHAPSDAPLRVFCLEDNPLLVFHLQQMIEDLGHRFAGSLESFSDLQKQALHFSMDCALIDIDLADGRSGPSAADWLSERGIPCVFVTGQEAIAAQYARSVVDVVAKPISERTLAAALVTLRKAIE